MKIIVIAPILNEAWILPFVLENFSSFADNIIVADQRSVDNTKEICKQFPKVTLITNPYSGYTNEVRFMLLDEARKIPGDKNLIVQLDADEFIHPSFVSEVQNYCKENEVSEAVAFSTEWLQMYPVYDSYRVDGVWKNNYKAFAFIDDRKIDYNRKHITNEHISRIPDIKNIQKLVTPILHVQYLAKKRCELKQVVYMCTERVQGFDPRKTNNRYSITKLSKDTPTSAISPLFIDAIRFPGDKEYMTFDSTKLDAILGMFKQKGSLFFEPLEIWHIKELKDYFIKENGRAPTKIQVFPPWLVALNNLKNKLKYKLLY